jgi:protein XRP2
MDAVSETESVIREKLENNGQLQKMRAMVVEASLKALTNDGKDSESLFSFSPTLTKAKKDPSGIQALSTLKNYLEFLGLSYTASVLMLESGLKNELLKEDQLCDAFRVPKGTPSLISLVTGGCLSKDVPDIKPASVPLVAPATATAAVAPTPQPTVKAAPAKAKSIESLYEIAKFDNAEFTRINQVEGQQVQLWELKDCKVFVFDALDSMTVDDCVGGELVLAACEGSLFIRNCKNMKVFAACKQLRLRDCENLDIHLFATTDPVVEMSHHIVFKPFNLRCPKLNVSFKAARLDAAVNRFVNVYDFTVDDPKLPQPHFTVQYPDHGLQMIDVGEQHGKPECPAEIEELLHGRLQPASSSESGQNKSHNIKSGSNAWQQQAAPVAVTTAPTVKPVDVKPVQIKPVEVKPVVTPVPVATVPVVPVVPVLPVPTVAPSAVATNEDQYSSYSESSADSDDKYEVEEDDDEF